MLKALIPMDGSEFSTSVFETVKKVLSPQAYTLTLLEVAPIPAELEDIKQGVPATWAAQIGYDLSSESVRRVLEPERSAYIERIWKSHELAVVANMAKAKQDLEQAGFSTETAVRFGDAAQEICDFVKLNHCDLVVMATHGRSGVSRVVMGSVAEKVLRSLYVPVMMMRPARTLADERLPFSDITEIADAMA
jgi:nucleotide-binding universal stress UspA family protein